MPEYVYRAVDKNGTILRNKVEDSSKQALIRRLKNNDLMPINIVQVGFAKRNKKTKRNKKNVSNIDDIMKTANSTNILKNSQIIYFIVIFFFFGIIIFFF